MRRSVKRTVATVVATVGIAFGLVACGPETPSATQQDQRSRDRSNANVVTKQPAAEVKYSPARAAKNFWIATWGQGPKNSYVYLMPESGNKVFYYVMDGPPTNRCDSLTPPDRVEEIAGSDWLRQAPRVDGVYAGGGQCDTYIGKDATTGTYMEFTLGNAMSVFTYSEPQAFPENILVPLGDTRQ